MTKILFLAAVVSASIYAYQAVTDAYHQPPVALARFSALMFGLWLLFHAIRRAAGRGARRREERESPEFWNRKR